MATAPQSRTEMPLPAPVPDAALIREQLNRLLTHSLFSHSKRYPVFLAYTVEQTLLGNAANLKERTIGAEAFGRRPDYDVNQDPVVRTSAAEVRKRLIQYYYDSAHAGELVIELSAGSYVPAFRVPDPQEMEGLEFEAEAAPDDCLPPPSRMRGVAFPQTAEATLPNAETPSAARNTSGFRWAELAALLLVALGRGHSNRPLSSDAACLQYGAVLGTDHVQPGSDHLLHRRAGALLRI